MLIVCVVEAFAFDSNHIHEVTQYILHRVLVEQIKLALEFAQ
jgi:hypothetical protein